MPWAHIALGVLVVAIWGSNFVVAHAGLQRFPPFTYALLRFALASLLLIAFVRPPKLPARSVIAYGLLIGCGQFGLLLYALDGHISAGLTSLLIQTQVFFTIALAWALRAERLRVGNILALALCAGGVLVVALNIDGSADLLGILLVLGAALAWAGGNLIARRSGDIDMLALMVWSGLAAVPPLLGAALLLEGPSAITASIRNSDALGWATLPWQSFANSLFGYSVWNWLLARHGTADVAPLGLLVPFFGMSTAAWLLAEPMPGWKLAAAALVLAGLATNLWTARQTLRTSQPRRMRPEVAATDGM